MTMSTLFGTSTSSKCLRLKTIRPIYETLKLAETATPYFKSTPLSSSHVVADLFGFLAAETKEYFLALHLNSKNLLLCMEVVSVGSLNAAIVHPREVFKSALLSSAAAVVCLHNHPSGDISPSKEDRDLTCRLQQAGDLLGIRMLDHLIIGAGGHYSFADRGEL